jgi:O-antigen/teichoic acid export membrane protein
MGKHRVLGAMFLVVACILGFFAYVAFTANSNPMLPHVYNLTYVLGAVSITFLILGIWLSLSGNRRGKRRYPNS